MRTRIYEVIEKAEENDDLSQVYDWFILFVVVLSLIPLAFREHYPVFDYIDDLAVGTFIADYVLRWLTADIKAGRKGIEPFLTYPFTAMAIIDLLVILPSLPFINNGFKLLRLVRMMRAVQVVRIFKMIRYSKSIDITVNVLVKTKESLMTVCGLALGYIIVSALIIFNVEPETFHSFFDAVYWATLSLTTVGYGDIYPVSTAGRVITMVSSFFGIAIVALPAGIITAGYMKELSDREKN